jgi:hypothetical protein
MSVLQRVGLFFYQQQNILASLAGLSWKELATLLSTQTSTVSEDAGIEPMTVATLGIGCQTLYPLARSHPQSARSHS